MLAKQGWRLLQNPDSLCAGILRAKCYPQGDPLRAKHSGAMSYTWRSIMRGIRVLKNGVIWRIHLKLAMKEHKPPPERSTHWSRPIEDTLKINSDGAYNGSTGTLYRDVEAGMLNSKK